MFCENCDRVICQNCMFENTHQNHEIVNLVEKFALTKSKISIWMDDVKKLKSFAFNQD